MALLNTTISSHGVYGTALLIELAYRQDIRMEILSYCRTAEWPRCIGSGISVDYIADRKMSGT